MVNVTWLQINVYVFPCSDWQRIHALKTQSSLYRNNNMHSEEPAHQTTGVPCLHTGTTDTAYINTPGMSSVTWPHSTCPHTPHLALPHFHTIVEHVTVQRYQWHCPLAICWPCQLYSRCIFTMKGILSYIKIKYTERPCIITHTHTHTGYITVCHTHHE